MPPPLFIDVTDYLSAPSRGGFIFCLKHVRSGFRIRSCISICFIFVLFDSNLANTEPLVFVIVYSLYTKNACGV